MMPRYFGVDVKNIREPSDVADTIVWATVICIIVLILMGAI
jgi:hypothetical protein